MTYRLTALTPLLVGDGQMLSPVDYMVWKDQVNVLNQRRIFKLLSKGPRLEAYLGQLRRAEKLDFASWGGFAQNYAGRRIPFEHSSSTRYWEQTHAEFLHIPTFCSGPAGAYLPASAIKGALRTGMVFQRWNAGVIKQVTSRMTGDRPLRHPGETAESMTLGTAGSDPMRLAMAGDSAPAPSSGFRVYVVRTSTLESRGAKLELGWKTAARSNAAGNKPDQATPMFVEMADPGTTFSGSWNWREYLKQPDVARALHLREGGERRIFSAANAFALELLRHHKEYCDAAGLPLVKRSLETVEAQLTDLQGRTNACIVNLGWGGGFLGKVAFLETGGDEYRELLRALPHYSRAIRTGLPFPKTRRVIFLGDQPAALPGWAVLEVS